jgi:hypothetical protein
MGHRRMSTPSPAGRPSPGSPSPSSLRDELAVVWCVIAPTQQHQRRGFSIHTSLALTRRLHFRRTFEIPCIYQRRAASIDSCEPKHLTIVRGERAGSLFSVIEFWLGTQPAQPKRHSSEDEENLGESSVLFRTKRGPLTFDCKLGEAVQRGSSLHEAHSDLRVFSSHQDLRVFSSQKSSSRAPIAQSYRSVISQRQQPARKNFGGGSCS